MRVTHHWRICRNLKALERGEDSALALANVPGYRSLLDFIIDLERAQTLEPAHPLGASWEFRFVVIYEESGQVRSMRLEILPALSRTTRIPVVTIHPNPQLSLDWLARLIRENLPISKR